MTAYRRVRRRKARERLVDETTAADRIDFAWHSRNLRERVAAGEAGDMALVVRLRLAAIEHDDHDCPRRGASR